MADPADDLAAAQARKLAQVEAEGGYQPAPPSPDDPEVIWSNALGSCYEMLVKVEEGIPAEFKAGSECPDPMAKKAVVYLAGGTEAVANVGPGVVSDAKAAGFTVQIVPVKYSTQQLEAVVEGSSRWSPEVQKVLGPGLVGIGISSKDNAIAISAERSATWTEAQAAELLGVPVIRTTDTIPLASKVEG
ncbi:hypothetical protein [Aestuariimicrobium sp. T2.26MG-19.2B]|uniref:hypothetical protein n=1 Tax=Aestuariimicrobium sp. T2.26MG-19.2B TaxID=3040679 RepID=UPI00253F69C5|nr:hypothetical protein [Aestuariimicrobium sp. T2.26MG-19.2B]